VTRERLYRHNELAGTGSTVNHSASLGVESVAGGLAGEGGHHGRGRTSASLGAIVLPWGFAVLTAVGTEALSAPAAAS
jgi:hypothetical protein